MPRTEVTGQQIKDQSVDLAVDVTGVLPVASGGTGASSLSLNSVLLGNGNGALQGIAPGAAGNALVSNGTSWVSGAVSSNSLSSGTLSGGTVVPQSGTITLFNTTDQITNTERGVFQWSSNRFEIGPLAAGTGTSRSLRIGTGATGATAVSRFLTISNSTPMFQFWPGTGAWAGDIVQIGNYANNTLTTSVTNYLNINPLISQSGNAGYTCILLNPTEGSVGTGNRRFVDFQMGGTSRLTIDVSGLLNTVGGLQVSGVPVVTTTGAQTITNKVISGSSNTITNVGLSSLATTGTASGSTYLRGDGNWAELNLSAPVIDGGSAADTTADIIDGGTA